MFEDSLLESAGRTRTHRSLTAAASFALQSVLLTSLALLPLLYTESLPGRLWAPNLVFVSPPPPTGVPAPANATRATTSEIWQGRLLLPPHIPRSIANIVEAQAPSASSIVGVPYGTSEGVPNGVLPGILTPGAAAPTLPPKPPTARLRVSQGVVEGLLLHQVKPAYPHLAMQTHTQGEVVLHAIIGRDGAVSSLQVVRGHPLLAPAAIDAVREWRYRPYTLNGEPVEVETLITVRFVLGN
jgi:periplasmic protein TonB